MASRRNIKGRTFYEDVVYFPILDSEGNPERNENGRKRYRAEWVRGRTKRECLESKQRLIDLRDQPEAVDETKQARPLSELYALVKKRHVDHLRPKTQEMWRIAIRKRIAPHFFDVPVKEITTEMIDDWVAELAGEIVTDPLDRPVIDPSTGKPKRKHGAASINRARTCLVKILNLGRKWHWIGERNAAEHATRLPEDTHVPNIYSPDQVLTMVIAVWTRRMEQVGRRGYPRREEIEYLCARDAAMIFVKAFSGMRISELVALRWKDIENDKQYTVRHQQDYSKPDHLGPVKSENGFRRAPMTNEMRLALNAWREIARYTDANDFVFSGTPDTTSPAGRARIARRNNRRVVNRKDTNATMIDVSGWRSRCFIPAVEYASFPEARPHAMRHTFVTLCKDWNVPAKDVASWIGDTEEVVNKIYTHASGSIPTDVFDRMSKGIWQ